MRAGAATGLNNAFWLSTGGRSTDPVNFEIDITETHYAHTHTMTLHNWSGAHTGSGKAWTAPFDLSEDYHIYALLWNPEELVWYFDGAEVRRSPTAFCRLPAPVRLSTAVGRFAGRITDALDGTHMDVDWVRVWTPAGAPGK